MGGNPLPQGGGRSLLNSFTNTETRPPLSWAAPYLFIPFCLFKGLPSITDKASGNPAGIVSAREIDLVPDVAVLFLFISGKVDLFAIVDLEEDFGVKTRFFTDVCVSDRVIFHDPCYAADSPPTTSPRASSLRKLFVMLVSSFI